MGVKVTFRFSPARLAHFPTSHTPSPTTSTATTPVLHPSHIELAPFPLRPLEVRAVGIITPDDVALAVDVPDKPEEVVVATKAWEGMVRTPNDIEEAGVAAGVGAVTVKVERVDMAVLLVVRDTCLF